MTRPMSEAILEFLGSPEGHLATTDDVLNYVNHAAPVMHSSSENDPDATFLAFLWAVRKLLAEDKIWVYPAVLRPTFPDQKLQWFYQLRELQGKADALASE